MFQHIDNEIASFSRTAEFKIELATILIDQTTGDILLFGSHVMVIGPGIAARLAPTGVVAQRYRRFTVKAQSHRLVRLIRLVLALKVVKNQVGLGPFFCGLALTTGRKR